MRIDSFRFLWSHAQFNFVWVQNPRNLSQSIAEMEGARYAVIFSIICTAPFHTFLLAYMLLRFQMENIQATGIELFNMLSLSFRYHDNGVYGIMIFDRDFRSAYATAKTAADQGRGDIFWMAGKLCSRWISSDPSWNDAGRMTLHHLISLINIAL